MDNNIKYHFRYDYKLKEWTFKFVGYLDPIVCDYLYYLWQYLNAKNILQEKRYKTLLQDFIVRQQTYLIGFLNDRI